MIDTEKYEGHTAGPWKWDKRGVLQGAHSVLWCNFTEPDPNWQLNNSAIHVSEADEELIADAPLLLAEVKQFHAFDEYMRMLRNGLMDVDDICDVWDEIRKERKKND